MRVDRFGWHGVVLSCLLLAACRSPTPAPPVPPVPPPPNQQQIRFSSALFSIYYRARLARGQVHESDRLMSLKDAASIVSEDARRFGDVWRVLAITQLAASGLERPRFRDAIKELAGTSRAPKILDEVLAGHPGAELLERERIVYEFILGPQTSLSVDPSGVPNCKHQYPAATPTHKSALASVIMTAWVEKPPADVARTMDPQSWDNACGNMFFNATYLTDLKAGKFETDKSYNATPGNPETVAATWGPRYLFEHFLNPGGGGGFFKNILKVETEMRSDGSAYAVKYYDLEVPIRSSIPPDPDVDGGLINDKGYLSATSGAAALTLLQGEKTVHFAAFKSHTPDQLGDAASTILKMMGNGLAYWVCCPK